MNGVNKRYQLQAKACIPRTEAVAVGSIQRQPQLIVCLVIWPPDTMSHESIKSINAHSDVLALVIYVGSSPTSFIPRQSSSS